MSKNKNNKKYEIVLVVTKKRKCGLRGDMALYSYITLDGKGLQDGLLEGTGATKNLSFDQMVKILLYFVSQKNLNADKSIIPNDLRVACGLPSSIGRKKISDTSVFLNGITVSGETKAYLVEMAKSKGMSLPELHRYIIDKYCGVKNFD